MRLHTAREPEKVYSVWIIKEITEQRIMKSITAVYTLSLVIVLHIVVGQKKSCRTKCLEENVQCVSSSNNIYQSVNCLIKKSRCKEGCLKETIRMLKMKIRIWHKDNITSN